MKSKISRRKFLKFLGGASGFLLAEISGVFPELKNLNAMDGKNILVLGADDRQGIRTLAERNISFKRLQEYLIKRKFEFQTNLIEAIKFREDTYSVNMLMMGYDEPEQLKASLIFIAGTSEGKPIESSFIWVADEGVYICKGDVVVPFPEGTERMQNVPRLPLSQPQSDNTDVFTLVRPVHAGHCPCHNLYSECYAYNALCAGLAAGCAAGCAPCCAAAAAACATAFAKCFAATQCGPPC